jgi:hypothetical protein
LIARLTCSIPSRLLLRGIHYVGQDPIQKFGHRRLMQEEGVLSPPGIGCQVH